MKYQQDESGQWWFYAKPSKRTKAREYICNLCKEVFIRISSLVKNPDKVYCSKNCCNKANSKVQSINKLGPKNYRWQGGRKKVAKGYIRIHMPEHPNRDNHNCILEHRYLMEQKIGRYLLPFETVHHINGIRDDNREENLELFVSNHPAGQRPEDLIKWAKEILALYDTIK